MKSLNNSSWVFIGLVMVLSLGLFFLNDLWSNSISSLPVYGEDNHHVENFNMTDQYNEDFSSEDYKGKIWVVNSFFTSCPTICPSIMKNMKETYDYTKEDNDVVMLSITVDPKHDTPEALLKYANRYNMASKNWKLLTGEKIPTYRLLRQSFLQGAADGGADDAFVHSENIMVVDQKGQIRDIINGVSVNADKEIINSINRLKKEANHEN